MPDFIQKRREMVNRYSKAGYIKTQVMKDALLKVPREEFMPMDLKEYAYYDQPFPIPGDGRQTISAPYMYPLTYELLNLKPGLKILEIGAGSGYGAALARQLISSQGLVVTIEINEKTYNFAKQNLEKTGYDDVIIIHGDGTLGYKENAPYDAISITASSPDIPPPLKEQLAFKGRLVAPVGGMGMYGQDLLLIEKNPSGLLKEKSIMKVQYVPLQGKYGWRRE
jgi:protein-L-isoaspartate(D-aspartate) O-methyltransferase